MKRLPTPLSLLIPPNLACFASLRESSLFRFCNPKTNQNLKYVWLGIVLIHTCPEVMFPLYRPAFSVFPAKRFVIIPIRV